MNADTFTTFIESRRETPFEWGVHDCMMFANGAVLSLYCKPAAFVEPYSDEREALLYLKSLCPEGIPPSLEAAVSSKLGKAVEAGQGGFPARGDIILSPVASAPFSGPLWAHGLGVCTGRNFVGVHPVKGIVSAPIEMGLKFWKIRP